MCLKGMLDKCLHVGLNVAAPEEAWCDLLRARARKEKEGNCPSCHGSHTQLCVIPGETAARPPQNLKKLLV